MKSQREILISELKPSTFLRGNRRAFPRAVLFVLVASCFSALAQAPPSDLPYTSKSHVMVRMSDGVQLAANIFLPKEGGPFPVILVRTPYGKMGEKFGEAKQYCPAGYAMVVQDCRGRGASQGIWDPFQY